MTKIEMSSDLSSLTEQYRQAVAQEWKCVKAGDAEIQLTKLFVIPHALEMPSSPPFQHHPELFPAPRWRKHARVAPAPPPSSSIPRRRGGQALPGQPQDLILPPSSSIPLSRALEKTHHLVLLGGPGAGKTITLQFIGLCFTQDDWSATRLGVH